MSDLFLSRAKLRRDVPLAALANVLVPANRVGTSHRLVWALFADNPDRERDFLWRETRPGEFMALAARPPSDPHGLFDLEFKPFGPIFASGVRLAFNMRCNPTISRDGKRHDVIMDALHSVSKPERAAARVGLMQDAAHAWLARQGEGAGFKLQACQADAYDRVQIPRDGAKPAVLGVLDVSGTLEVTDPTPFLARLTRGFGRARAFGCGLMLIRRA